MRKKIFLRGLWEKDTHLKWKLFSGAKRKVFISTIRKKNIFFFEDKRKNIWVGGTLVNVISIGVEYRRHYFNESHLRIFKT